MKTLLLHAPGDSPCDAPWMGVPALVAHLKKVGYPDTHQRDLDLDLYYASQKADGYKRMSRLFKEGIKHAPKTGPLYKRLFLHLFGLPAMWLMTRWELRDLAFFEKFRRDTPVNEQFPEDGKIRYRRTAQGILKMMAIWYYPYQSYPKFFSLREKNVFWKLHLRLGYLFNDYLNLGHKALESYYEDYVVPMVKDGNYDVVGISVSVQRQYDTAIILAEVLRKHNVRAKLILGGSYISETYDSEWLEDEILAKFDYTVRYEGEDALHRLLLHFEGKGELEDAPNLIYMKDGVRVEHKRDRVRDINVFAAPDYDDLPLDHYLDRPVRLPIMGNRGCYWAKCTFCAHFWSLGVGAMRDRSAVKLIDDVKTLQAKYNVRHFFFADESIYPPTIEDFCELVHEEGLDINWSGMIRFEECMTKEYLEMMHGAGCHVLLFGLESISPGVQDIIKKGVEIPIVWRVLRDAKEVGLNVHLFMILGTPGETKEEMEENINFLLDNTDLYKTVQLASFELTMGSPMTLKPERYGIADIQVHDRHGRKAFSDVEYTRTTGLTNAEVDKYVEYATTHPVLFAKDYWSGFGFQIYEPNGLHVNPALRPKQKPTTDPRSLSKDPRAPKTVGSGAE
ncbi:B12-binding domain-containing radical SAM protein [Engelhardtia mirabilis]|uniref:Radical SAM superfamily protein n=1 Tax=Engelhardtia mirabilis TaxID=2528011 RepID=A0A518BMT1_9BACT|nr:Radical SAM superfamily protein [Planctomycetes bacterium Pla133]QDV02610.1 Radical SAM superfamily protein [Planctomycetes bacterium Pla86]